MAAETHGTRIALLEQGQRSRIKEVDARLAELSAELTKLKLQRQEASAQKDRNIRWLGYGLIAAVVTNLVGAEEAVNILLKVLAL